MIEKLKELLESATPGPTNSPTITDIHRALCLLPNLVVCVEALQTMHEARTTDEEEHGYEVIELALAALNTKLETME